MTQDSFHVFGSEYFLSEDGEPTVNRTPCMAYEVRTLVDEGVYHNRGRIYVSKREIRKQGLRNAIWEELAERFSEEEYRDWKEDQKMGSFQ